MPSSIRFEAILVAASLLMLTTVGCGQEGQSRAGAPQQERQTAQKDDSNPAAPASEEGKPLDDEPTPTIEQATAELEKIHAKIDVDKKDPAQGVTRIRLQDPNAVNDKMYYLKPFTNLKQLEIVYFNNISGEGFKHIQGMTSIEMLYLEGTNVGDVGLQYIQKLTNLRRLDLINSGVTDAGLVHLAGLKRLYHLTLNFTEVTDAGLEHLKALKGLKNLELDDTKVTEEGVKKLQAALPKCKIHATVSGANTKPAAIAAVDANAPAIATTNGDWPQWRGPNRDGVSGEAGLLAEWPEEGPPLLWKKTGIGWGFSTISVANGTIYGTGCFNGKMYLSAFNPENGERLWQSLAAEDDRQRVMSTPTVDGDFLYAMAWEGELVCAKTADGSIVWRRNLAKDFDGVYQAPGEGGAYSESVLIDGDKLICTPGAKDAAVVALDKHNGKTIWKAAFPEDVGPQGKDAAGFSSVVLSHGGGVRQYVQLSGRGLISVAADDGRTLWGYNRIANTYANISTPIASGDYVFASTIHAADPNAGTVLLKLVPNNGGVKAEEVYRLTFREAANHHGGMVLVGDYIYMGHGYNRGFPLCLEMKTGKVLWGRNRGPGTGSASIVYADGRLYFHYEDGAVALIDARPDAYVLKGHFKLPVDGDKDWAHPVVSHGRLYIRGQDKLMCYDVTKR